MILIPLNLKGLGKNSPERNTLESIAAVREETASLMAAEKYYEALEKNIAALRTLRDFPDYDNVEFRAAFASLLFDLTELHHNLKDYRQSEKELETLFKVLARLIEADEQRFGELYIQAMTLSTRILRSRKKVMEMLTKQQLMSDALLEKVNAGVSSATERLVESLRKEGQLMAAAGKYKEALRYFSEAIKLSKKRSGRVSRREIKLTIEMAEIMMRIRSMRPRAKRLLAAVLPHAIQQEIPELESDIVTLLEIMEGDDLKQPRWRTFLLSLTKKAKK